MNTPISEPPIASNFNAAWLDFMPPQDSSGSLACALLAQPQQAARVHASLDLATVLNLLYG
ncbi:MAG: hypothetical protein ACKOBA_08175 [Limnohabitans sp.]